MNWEEWHWLAKVLLCVGVLAWLIWQRRLWCQPVSRMANLAWAGILLIAVATWFGSNPIRNPATIHYWDSYHYYLGAKYFRELNYTGLYDCTVLADAEVPIWNKRIFERDIRDLKNNRMRPARELLDAMPDCRGRFTAARWAAFTADVGFFRARIPRQWYVVQKDHGFNASPAWLLVGGLIANQIALSDATLPWINSIDFALLLAALAAAIWGFGLRATAVAAVVLATLPGAETSWTYGSLWRWDWFAALVAAAACWRRQWWFISGGLLAYAALSRVFPAALAAGPLLLLFWAWRRREPLGTFMRWIAGFVAVAVMLIGLAAVQYDNNVWQEFTDNLGKHAASPLANNMGLATVLTFQREKMISKTVDPRSSNPYAIWEDAKRTASASMQPLLLLLSLAAVVALALVLRRSGNASLAIPLATLVLPFLGVELTCYYYMFLFVTALAIVRWPSIGITLLVGNLAILILETFGLWHDVRFALESLVLVTVFAIAAGTLMRKTGDGVSGQIP